MVMIVMIVSVYKVIPLPSSTCSDRDPACDAIFITDSIFSVHASMYSDGGDICDATLIDNDVIKVMYIVTVIMQMMQLSSLIFSAHTSMYSDAGDMRCNFQAHRTLLKPHHLKVCRVLSYEFRVVV